MGLSNLSHPVRSVTITYYTIKKTKKEYECFMRLTFACSPFPH